MGLDIEMEKEYVPMKECPRNESFADGNVGAGVKLMAGGGRMSSSERE